MMGRVNGKGLGDKICQLALLEEGCPECSGPQAAVIEARLMATRLVPRGQAGPGGRVAEGSAVPERLWSLCIVCLHRQTLAVNPTTKVWEPVPSPESTDRE